MPKYPMPVFKGIGVCIPLGGRPVPPAWAFAFKGLDPPINTNIALHTTYCMEVDKARNHCVEWAQQQGFKYIFFIGDDTVPDVNPLPRFIYLLEQNPQIDVLGGVYVSKSNPPAPLIFQGSGQGPYWDWKLGELIKVWATGMDCTMIRMSVFDKLEKPWFLTVRSSASVDGVAYSEGWTEDLWFAEKLKKAGGQWYCDTSIQCGHWDVNEMKEYRLPMDSKPAVRRMVTGDKRILDVGCGKTVHTFPEGVAVRADLLEDCSIDYRCDIRALPFANESFDIIYASHILEHHSREAVPKVLDEWIRVLAPKGELRLIVPDIAWAAKRLIKSQAVGPDQDTMNVLYGGQRDASDFHRAGFTPASLKALLESKGLSVSLMKADDRYSLAVAATKTESSAFMGDGQGILIEKKAVNALLEKSKGHEPTPAYVGGAVSSCIAPKPTKTARKARRTAKHSSRKRNHD